MTDKNDPLEYLRKATAALQEAKQRLRKYEDERHEPIAIVSMACRFPGGVETPEALWRLLDEGRDAITEVPASRWDVETVFDPRTGVQGKTYSRWGGFVGKVDRFDPLFFGMNALEARSSDPQQRLLLETTWEVIERAGLTPSDLTGSATGVFVGIFGNEYQTEVMRDHRTIDTYSLMGTDHGLISGRISYWLGLRGPNFPVDTACSSSAVALHLACQSLRNHECDMALSGGVNLLLAPWTYVYLSWLQLLSPTGRCHTFAADADGFARAEGCGMVLLKRLSDAQRAGDNILAVIRGSAINHDGRSNGFTAPSGPAQEEVIRRALKQARVEPSTVDFVECHSTGTQLGDPIEVQALGAVYGRGRPAERPLVLGSIKTNIGHAEGAAGIAGVMKAVLSLQHRRIPRSLHFARPNPLIPWDELPVRVAAEALPWERNGHPRRAGVSSFAMSGANAHLILEEAPEVAERSAPEASSYLLPLSAKSSAALVALARSYAHYLSSPGDDAALSDIVYTASARRVHREHRLAIAGRTREDFAAALLAFAPADPPADPGVAPAGAAHGQVSSEGHPTLVFVFSDQSSQSVGMGRRLLAEEPVFRAKLEACDALLRRQVSWSLLEELSAPEERSRLGETEVAQPALFALHVGLAELLKSWGVTPDAVIGYGVGEVAAAHVAGALSLEDAVRLAALRGRIMKKAIGPGNVEELARELVEALGRVEPGRASVPMYSAGTGAAIVGEALDAAYWGRNVGEPVLFTRAVESAFGAGHRLFLEVGPHPVLSTSLAASLAALPGEGHTLFTLQRGSDERIAMLQALGALYARGLDVAWTQLFPSGGRCVALPTYPWQRERYWIEASTPAGGERKARANRGGHPLLGHIFELANRRGAHYWEQWVSIEELPYLADHLVRGDIVVPGAGFVEMALAAATEVFGEQGFVLENLSFEWMLSLAESESRRVQVSLVDEQDGSLIEVSSRDEASREWARHAVVTVRSAAEDTDEGWELPQRSRERCPVEVEAAAHYAWMEARQIQYGPAFLGVERVWLGTGEALARVRLPDEAGDAGPYRIHPALLDACFQVSAALFATVAPNEPFVPVQIERVRLRSRMPRSVWVRAMLAGPSPGENDLPALNLAVVDEEGWPLLEVDGLRMERLASAAAPDPFAGCAYEIAWQRKELSEEAAPSVPSSMRRGTWVLFVDEGGTAAAVARHLRAQGQRCIEVAAGSRFERKEASRYTIDPSKPQDYQRVFREVVGDTTVCRGVAHFWSLDAAPWGSTSTDTLLADIRRGTLSALHVVQELVWQGFRDAPRLVLVTRGAQAAGGDASIVSGSQAPLWGLGRTIAMEQPDLACTRVDLAPGGSADEAAELVREILSSDGEDQIAFRNEGRLVARLERGDVEPAGAAELDPDVSYLITGGLGGLGLAAARWMVSRGARHLLLLGRSAPTKTALEAIHAMEEAGARVHAWQADVSRAAEVEGALVYLEENMPPLRGVVHAAGVTEDRTLQEMGEEQFSQPIRPKVLGAWNLHTATRGIPLDFFVMYSSVAALLGSPGQGNYAAANAFLDALAHARTAEGLPAMSIQWGAFSQVGMVAEQENQGKRLAHRGIDSFTPDEGTELLSRLLQQPRVEVGLVRMSVRLWVEFYPRAAVMPFLTDLREEEGRMSMSGALSPLRESLQDLTVAERRSALERHVLECLGRVLRLEPEQINAAAPFRDYGMDSLMSLEIRNRLEPGLGLKLSAALLYTYPTTVALIEYLLVEMRLETGRSAEPADRLRPNTAEMPIRLSEEAAVAMLDEKLLDLEDYLK